MSGAGAMGAAILITLAVLVLLIAATIRSIMVERTGERSVWREFGLGLVLMILFFSTWAAQGVAQWQQFTDEAASHGDAPEIGDFVSEFGSSTLENWQSEFLQLFSFVVLASLYIHKGSAESKDSDEKLEASLRRIEERLGTLPEDAPRGDEGWMLPDTPLRADDPDGGDAGTGDADTGDADTDDADTDEEAPAVIGSAMPLPESGAQRVGGLNAPVPSHHET